MHKYYLWLCDTTFNQTLVWGTAVSISQNMHRFDFGKKKLNEIEKHIYMFLCSSHIIVFISELLEHSGLMLNGYWFSDSGYEIITKLLCNLMHGQWTFISTENV